jgi:hypothetical protein
LIGDVPLARGLRIALFVCLALSLWRGLGAFQSPSAYLLQAEAWLSGSLRIARPFHDAVPAAGGGYHLVFPPAPALLLLPLVAVLGSSNAASLVLAAALAFVAYRAYGALLAAHGLSQQDIAWLLPALFLGSALWSIVATFPSRYSLAHLTAFTFMGLALLEAERGKRPWLSGLCLGVAILSRQMSVWFLPLLLYRNAAAGGRRLQRGLAFALPVALCAAVTLGLNHLRFGDAFATGYASMQLSGFLADRVERYGLFHPVYVPFNFVHLFLQGPHFPFEGPELLKLVPGDPFGSSLTFASPFVFAACYSRLGRSERLLSWCGVIGCVCATLLYYNNGWKQWNCQRFTLDFWPVLFVLVATGVHAARPLFRGLVFYAVALNAVALVLVPGLSLITKAFR